MTFVPSSFQPGLPANGSLWKTLSTFLVLIGLVSALIGSLSHLFEQVDRRTEERRRAERQRRRRESSERFGQTLKWKNRARRCFDGVCRKAFLKLCMK
jgi:hypothetical protein